MRVIWRQNFVVGSILLALVLSARAGAQDALITLRVDASEAQRRIFHARLTFPATPGPLTLFYPQWLVHEPIGPINNLVGMKMTAAGKPLPWRRDSVNMYAFHADVPPGATSVDVSLDYVSPSGGSWIFDPVSTDQLLVLQWNLVTLYPQGKPASDYIYKASLVLPSSWKFGTALPVASQSSETVEFEPVSLVTLIDSPVIAGAHYRVISLSAPGLPPAEMHIAADSEAALQAPREFIQESTRLMQEAEAMFGGHHYRSYHFLVALSDHLGRAGIESHESSDNRFPENALIEVKLRGLLAGQLAHELAHSWNGKYRRPDAIATPDYQVPMKDELNWVYEGLTEYLGEVLERRSGLATPESFREVVASYAAEMDYTAGRVWRPLADTAVSTPVLEGAPSEWTFWRRDGDFYSEAALIWLEADTIIRQQSNGRRSLDDFCHTFFGPPSGSPMVKPYSFDDLVAALNQVSPYNWRGFFRTRVYEIAPRAPLGGIEQGGWKLVYNAKPNEVDEPLEDLSYSIGMVVEQQKNEKEGSIVDVVPDMPAAKAGIAPGMKLLAVNGRPWSPEILLSALKPAPGTLAHLVLRVENAGFVHTCILNYGGGPRYPHLERDPSRPDLMGEIIKPHAPH